jgi:acyltransferase
LVNEPNTIASRITLLVSNNLLFPEPVAVAVTPSVDDARVTEADPADAPANAPSTIGLLPTNRAVASQAPRAERFEFVDSARAAGIILVVLGHAWPADALATRMIYGFHMPLFFFLSGAVLRDATLNLSPRAFVARQARTLVIPYLFFAIVSVLFFALRRVAGLAGEIAGDASLADVVRIIAVGSGSEIRIVNSTLWFFTALFAVSLYYYGLRRIVGRWTCLVASFAAAYLLLKLRPADAPVLPWNADVALVCLPFYALGAVFVRDGAVRAAVHRATLPLAVAALAAGLALAAVNVVRVDLRDRIVGDVELFFSAALLGVCGAAVLAAKMPSAPLSRRLAEASIAIFPLHIFVLIVLATLGRKLGPTDPSLALRMCSGVFATGAAILVCLPAYDLLKKYVPAAVGGRRLHPTLPSPGD